MKRLLPTAILLTLIISTSTLTGQVILNQFYASTGNIGNAIIKISPTSGGGTVFAPSGSFGPVTEVQFSPDGSTLYGTTGGGTSSLITIDLTTGVESLVGVHIPGAINGMEFVDGILYGTHWNSGDCGLVIINPDNGQIIDGDYIAEDPITGLAHNVVTGVTYGIVQVDGDEEAFLIIIDLSIPDITDGILLPDGIYRGLAFGPDGTLYTAMYDFISDKEYLTSINILTGETSQVTQITLDVPVSGLTYYIPQHIYSSPGNNGDFLAEIDVMTGATPVGLIGDFGPVTEIQHDPTGKFLYGTTGGGTRSLIKIDINTGDELLIAEHAPGAINGMEFYNYTLYGSYINPSSDSSILVKIDTLTGDLTPIGPMVYGPITGLAYDYTTRIMYGMAVIGESSQSELVTIDLNTGATTVLGPVIDSPWMRGLVFGPYGNMYTANYGPGDVYFLSQINPETLEITQIGVIPQSVSGLSYYNAPPVPLSNWAIIMGVLLMGMFLVLCIKPMG